MKTGRSKMWMKRVLAVALCICMLSTLLCDAAFASSGGSQTNFIVRHWHANGDYTEQSGYITSDNDVYCYDSTSRDYVKLTGDVFTVTPIPWDYDVVDALGGTTRVTERFTSFSVAAGSSAVTLSTSDLSKASASIRYRGDIPLVKLHVFYSLDGNTLGYDFGTAGLSKSAEEDVLTVTEDNIGSFTDLTGVKIGDRIYDTSAGLHTNKTASLATAAGLNDGRTFNLTLESWYAGQNLADVGLILDASGSMAFLTTGLDEKALHQYSISTDDKCFDSDARPSVNQFLTQDQVDRVLNKNLTDNSPLSYSDYTYYIKDERDNVKEYVPLGYWDGNTDAEGRDNPLKTGLVGMFQFDRTVEGGGAGETKYYLNGATGTTVGDATGKHPKTENDFKQDNNSGATVKPTKGALHAYMTHTTDGVCQSTLELGTLVNSAPFTVSFAVKTKTDAIGTDSDSSRAQDLMTIKNGTGQTFTILRGARSANNSRNHVRWLADGSSTNYANLNNVLSSSWTGGGYSNDQWRVFTYVVDASGTITAYVDGKYAATENTLDLGSGPFSFTLGGTDAMSSGPYLDLDEVYIYDRALSSGEVGTLYETMKKPTASVTDPVEPENTVAHFDNGTDMQLGSDSIAKLDETKRAGWYYVNSSGSYDSLSDTGSAKSLRPLQVPKTGGNNVPGPDNGQYPTTPTDLKDASGSNIAGESITGASPCQFYIGSDNLLHCIFNSSGQNVRDAVVYIKDSGTRTKAEELQHALGTFVNQLDMSSPDSRVSAVRFSSDDFKDYTDELLMQTWTDDPSASTGIMGLQRGRTEDGVVKSWNNDSGLYNYVMTGGTYAYTGLQAFKASLADDAQKGAAKYVILFTDGKDGELTDNTEITEEAYKSSPETIISKIKETEAVKTATELKNKDYTIYCVMLVSADAASQETVVQEFLRQISSGNGSEGFVYTAEKSADLDSAFDKILGEITFDLDGYTVQDYIDPRFDLVANTTAEANASDRKTIHLHDGGEIEIDGSTETLTSSTGKQLYFITGSTGASMATLYYDSDAGMYYLQWTDQTIPGCNVNAHQLNVWRSTVTVRAKEDLIGGNAVLSNGNAASQNYVFSPGDGSRSSGAGRSTSTPPVQGLPPDHGQCGPAAQGPGCGADHLSGRDHRPGQGRQGAGRRAGR